ncbi:MAG: LPS export ABC transporter periplasmic protein LptC [Ignavibacteriae bacterium]|nr:LPS export ABC transporter periplasmic protein LptC [Ignavibacteriota bacterium]
MLKLIPKIFLILMFALLITNGQTQEKRLTIIGDSLKGKIVNGESIREVIGNVIITKDDVKITCNKAIQYLAKNEALLIGNVIIVQDSVTIKTERGRYFSSSELTVSDTTIHLDKIGMNLIADKGRYNLSTNTAKFYGNIIFKDADTELTSDSLFYNEANEKLIAIGNVNVSDSTSIVKADSLIHFRKTKFTNGFGNVQIISKENDLTIFGNELVDDKGKNILKVSGNPLLRQIEKLNNEQFDTLFILSKTMEVNSDSSKELIAKDSVKIIRGGFLSSNDYTIYNQLEELITILRQNEKSAPILWYENSQMVGDSIYIKLDSSKISSVNIFNEATIISKDSTYIYRYNQMSGDSIKLSFTESKLSETNVKGNVLSIYYLYEEGQPNGLLKSSAKQIKILFKENRVSDVKMYGEPMSEYHPENLVKDNEKGFTLPSFILYENKPNKNIIKEKYKVKITLEENNK